LTKTDPEKLADLVCALEPDWRDQRSKTSRPPTAFTVESASAAMR